MYDFFSDLNNLKVYPPITRFEEINITKALTTPGRLHYPKVAKKSKLDDFLNRRTQLKMLEERQIAQTVSKPTPILISLHSREGNCVTNTKYSNTQFNNLFYRVVKVLMISSYIVSKFKIKIFFFVCNS